MKNYVFYLLAFLGIMLTSCESNELASDDPTTDPTDVYIAGFKQDENYVSHAFLTKNDVDVALQNQSLPSYASCVKVHNGDVYTVGSVSTDGTEINRFAVLWKNGQIEWTGNSGGIVYSDAFDIEFSGTDIYISGVMETEDTSAIVYWKNGVVNIMPETNNTSVVYSNPKLLLVGSDVYVTGMSYNSEGFMRAAYWKNGIRHLLSGSTMGFSSAYDIDKLNDDIYIVGTKGQTGGVYWKNDQMFDLPNSDIAKSIKIENNNVYIIGSTTENKTGVWKNDILTSFSTSTLGLAIDVKNDNQFISAANTFEDFKLVTYINGVESVGSTRTFGTSIFAD